MMIARINVDTQGSNITRDEIFMHVYGQPAAGCVHIDLGRSPRHVMHARLWLLGVARALSLTYLRLKILDDSPGTSGCFQKKKY